MLTYLISYNITKSHWHIQGYQEVKKKESKNKREEKKGLKNKKQEKKEQRIKE